MPIKDDSRSTLREWSENQLRGICLAAVGPIDSDWHPQLDLFGLVGGDPRNAPYNPWSVEQFNDAAAVGFLATEAGSVHPGRPNKGGRERDKFALAA